MVPVPPAPSPAPSMDERADEMASVPEKPLGAALVQPLPGGLTLTPAQPESRGIPPVPRSPIQQTLAAISPVLPVQPVAPSTGVVHTGPVNSGSVNSGTVNSNQEAAGDPGVESIDPVAESEPDPSSPLEGSKDIPDPVIPEPSIVPPADPLDVLRQKIQDTCELLEEWDLPDEVLLQLPNAPPADPITQRQLAELTGIPATAIQMYKLKPDFPDWIRQRSPQGFTFIYSAEDGLFHPAWTGDPGSTPVKDSL